MACASLPSTRTGQDKTFHFLNGAKFHSNLNLFSRFSHGINIISFHMHKSIMGITNQTQVVILLE